MNFLHSYQPQPIFLDLGFISIRWYGLIMSLAILLGLLLAVRLARKIKINSDEIYDLALWSVVGGIMGARAYEVFIINWSYYAHNLSAMVKIWQGGLAIHGAIIGGALAVWFWAKKNKKEFWPLLDLIAVVMPLGQALGRWGNYFNQELFGRPTTWFIGIPIAEANRPVGFETDTYFQPTFLYESILNLGLFFGLFLIYKKFKAPTGTLAMVYLLGYSTIRFFMEFVRLDPTPVLGWLRLPQLVSLIIFGLVAMFLIRKKVINFFFG